MKKFCKVFLLFAFCFIIFGFTKTVQANSIEKISMDIYINKNGNAIVTEVWSCQASSGTEIYHPYYNLGNSKITNLTVSDSGTTYQTLGNWTTSGSLQSKAQKCGIHNLSNGVELCWGISSYGFHTYTVKYTITNFIADLNDYQMIYWTLIPYDFSNRIGNAYIKIHADEAFPNGTPIWGYGNYGGTAYAYDGYIEMQSKNGLDADEYMTILVQFPKGTFNTANSLNNNFDYYYKMAEEGAIHYKKNNINPFVVSFGFIFGAILILFLRNFILTNISNLIARAFKPFVLHKPSDTKFSKKDIEYFRDIPCNNDIFRAFYVGYNYNILKNNSNLLGSIILKWLKDSIIKIEHKETSHMFKKDDISIIFKTSSLENYESKKEKELFNMLHLASKDEVLSTNEFKKWCKSNYELLFKWFDNILEDQRDKFVIENLVIHKQATLWATEKYSATPELRQEALKLAGLKKYLEDYTLIKNREPIEVKLFENYLIYAQLMCIADTVAKNFKDLYPDIVEQSNFDSYNDIILANTLASRSLTYALSAKSKAEAYSSGGFGGGGFSSGGGGGGSFGGGGGGGGFR